MQVQGIAVVRVHDAILDQELAITKGLFNVLAAKVSGHLPCSFGAYRAWLSYLSVGTLNDAEILLLEVRECDSISMCTSL